MDEITFLDKDYERKIDYLVQQFGRMWTRFNIFVTIESSLIGAKFLVGTEGHNSEFAVLGIMLSFIWYVFGANDKYLVDVYRAAVEEAGKKFSSLVTLERSYFRKTDFHLVGDTGSYPDVKNGLLRWRFQWCSITHMAALFPLVFMLVWTVYLIVSL